MELHEIVRGIGVIGMVFTYGIYAISMSPTGGMYVPLVGEVKAFVITIMGIILLVSPETIDRLPFGPSKK